MATLYGFATELATGVLPLASWDHDDGPGWIIGLFFWIAVIALVVLVLRSRGWLGSGGPRVHHESGTQILERRFAEGELSADEYRERRAVLDERDKA
jgi:putative membrane protein